MVFWTDIYYVFKREFYAVFRDHAVLTLIVFQKVCKFLLFS